MGGIIKPGDIHMLGESREALGRGGLDHKLAAIAKEVEAILRRETGDNMGFSLFVYPHGQPHYVSNIKDYRETITRMEYVIDRMKKGTKPLIYSS